MRGPVRAVQHIRAAFISPLRRLLNQPIPQPLMNAFQVPVSRVLRDGLAKVALAEQNVEKRAGRYRVAIVDQNTRLT